MRKAMLSAVFAWCLMLVATGCAWAQRTGEGSATTDNSIVIVAAGTVELRFSERSYFGPNAHWEINGTLEIWSKEIWIAPTATFTGTGRIIIHDPGTNPYYDGMASAPTRIDGNDGRHIGIPIVLQNPNNLVLADIDDPGYGTDNPGGPKAAALNIGAPLDLAVDGGDIILNGYDMGLNAEGMLVNFSSNRMVVTGNSVAGHLTKTYGHAGPFVFPVGIAEGDYTPVTVAPERPTTVAVSVQDYEAAAISLTHTERGMDRIWHIFAQDPTEATFTAQHNKATNGVAYVDRMATVVQYTESRDWMGGATHQEAEGIHTRAGVAIPVSPDAPGSWVTKWSLPAAAPAITITKVADRSGFSAFRENINYTITVSNTGPTELLDVRVSDPLTGFERVIAALAPGAYESFRTAYSVTDADIIAGKIDNVARVEAHNGDGIELHEQAELTVPYVCNGETFITGRVYRADAGDAPLANVIVALIPRGESAANVRLQVTDAAGRYRFEGADEGAYLVQVRDANLNLVQRLFPVESSLFFTTLANCQPLTQDFAYAASDFPAIGDFVWLDVNGDGLQNEWFDANGNNRIDRVYPDEKGYVDYSQWEWIDLNGNGTWDRPEDEGELNKGGIGNDQTSNIRISGPGGYTSNVIIGAFGYWRDRPSVGGQWEQPLFGDFTVELVLDDPLIANVRYTAALGKVKTYNAAGEAVVAVNGNRTPAAMLATTKGVYNHWTLPRTMPEAGSGGRRTVNDRIPVAALLEFMSARYAGDPEIIATNGLARSVTLTAANRINLDVDFGLNTNVITDIPPTAVKDIASVESGASVDIDVLRNDKPGNSAIVPGSVRVISYPQTGSVRVNADGTVTYTAPAGYTGMVVFTYEITDENGLTSLAEVTVTVTPRPLHIPNVFSPNGDGQNDVFEIIGIEGVDRVELTVINRWGNEVYRNTNYRNDWNGGNLNEGTYYYEVVTHKQGQQQRYVGWVLIKRM